MMRLLSKKLSFIIALSLYFSTIEALFPHPPFIRYGFAYIPLMIFASRLNLKEFCTAILFKSFISGLLSVSLFSPFFLMTIVSSFISGAAIFYLERLKCKNAVKISHVGVSVVSAFVSNISQILLSYLIFFGDFSLFLSPIVFVAGFISSVVVGGIANKYENRILNLYNISDDISGSVKHSLEYKIREKTILRFVMSFVMFCLCVFISSFFRPQGNVLYTIGAIKICDISLYRATLEISLFALLCALSFITSIVLVKRNGIKTNSIWIYFFYLTMNSPIANKNK